MTRVVTIVAQDPTLRYEPPHPRAGQIVTAAIRIPDETLHDGPRGYRVHCIDFDASTETYYATRILDPNVVIDDAVIFDDPSFHCQNVYAIVMHTLARFERALGRRVSWGFYGHQLKVAPHAFAEANAFYSKQDHALLFGYFYTSDGPRPVFTSLSHDIIVHETTHALLDGLRTRYTDPSSADQAAFHEGFADVVALLSIFALEELPELLLERDPELRQHRLIDATALRPEALRAKIGNLAVEFGAALSGVRGQPLRNSLSIDPREHPLANVDEPHARGEYFVAAMINSFIELWGRQIGRLGDDDPDRRVDRSKVIEEGAHIADMLLDSAIRALDYCPPVDLLFGDYLSGFLTADTEFRPDDRINLRKVVRETFAMYGIEPEAKTPEGTWDHAPAKLTYDATHFEPMKSDPDEVFHFVWENRQQDKLRLVEDGYTRILSVRPSMRVGADGFVLHETVAEYLQVLQVRAGDLGALGLRKPDDMPDTQPLDLYGGGSLIFGEYGQLKYHVYNTLLGSKQSDRIDYLWRSGQLAAARATPFAALHRLRSIGGLAFGEAFDMKEIW